MCTNTVWPKISAMASNCRNDLKTTEIPQAFMIGGGISSDGVKVEETGRKYYDFILHYIHIDGRQGTSKTRTWKIIRRLLFIARSTGSESAHALRDLMDSQLKQFDTSIENLNKEFTFVTDCAATMPTVFGASVSPNRVSYSELWIACIAHQFNTAMKNAYEDENCSFIQSDMENLKVLIRIFTKSGLNEKSPSGKSLKKEVPTRFGTTFYTVERFLSSASKVTRVLGSEDQEAARSIEAFDKIKCNMSSFVNLEAIVTRFKPIRHAQTLLEADSKPTIMQVIPALETIKKKLRLLSNGVRQGPDLIIVEGGAQTLAKSTLDALDKIQIHDL